MCGLHPDVVVRGQFDSEAWSQQIMWWSERQRSRALLWPPDERWFTNDPLGPMPHTHPSASEAVLVAKGQLRLTVGRDDVHMAEGDYCLIPPDTYHDPLNTGDDDLCLFVLVAPNWRGNRWKNADFTDDDLKGTTRAVSTAHPGPLPSDDSIQAEVIQLGPGETQDATVRWGADRSIYVLDGSAELTVDHLSGELGPHQFTHVMSGATHRIANRTSKVTRLLSLWACDPPEH